MKNGIGRRLRGLQTASDAQADEAAVLASASAGMSGSNVNTAIAKIISRLSPVMRRSGEPSLPVREYVTWAVACPYDGNTGPAQMARSAAETADRGCSEISPGDTIGAPPPGTVSSMLRPVTRRAPAHRLAGRFHRAGGSALANIFAAMEFGLRANETSIGALGDCPFAPGNAAAERVTAAW